MFSNLGSSEIVFIAILLLVLFGSKKLTELSRGLGKSVHELKKIQKDIESKS